VALPEQHALGFVVSVSGPMQLQTPPVQIPELHSTLAVQAAPLGRCGWQVPPSHSPETHALLSLHGALSACGAAQRPASHQRKVQSPSPVQAAPFAWRPQLPSMHSFDWHCSALVQALPSDCGSSHVPW
jgi:hypothetical protein